MASRRRVASSRRPFAAAPGGAASSAGAHPRPLDDDGLFLATILEHAPVMVTCYDAAGTLIWANPALERTLGWPLEEFMRTGPLALCSPNPAARAAALAHMLAPPGPWGEFEMRTRDGGARTIAWSNVRLADGRSIGFGRDVTERIEAETARRHLEDQLHHARRMEAMGQLAGGIAHDFNNLLTVIAGNLDFVREDLPPGHPVLEDVAQITAATDRARDLVRQLLAFGRRQVLAPRAVDVNAVMRTTETLLRRLIGEEIVLCTVLAGEDATVVVDPAQLDQVILNLVLNARDAIVARGREARGGTLTLETEVLRFDADSGAAWGGDEGPVAPGDYVLLAVRDTGIGMSADVASHAFEPFFTTKAHGRGSGLGLATVYGIVAQSGGRVRIDSIPGRGTTVLVLLPRATEAAPAAGTAPAVTAYPRGTGTVLLVEDESPVRATARRMLERHGYHVLEARHGADALVRFRARRDEIVAIVTDIRMPEMGGIEFVRRLRAEAPRMPVVFASGYADTAHVVNDPELERFVPKPFHAEQLLRALHEVRAAAFAG